MTTSLHFLTLFLFLSTCFFLPLALSTILSSPPLAFFNENVTINASPRMVSFPIHHVGSFFNHSKSYIQFMLAGEKAKFRTPVFPRLHGEHVVEVRIGTYRLQTHLLLDTGSPLIWWQCYPCKCFPQKKDAYYQYEVSPSYEEVDCMSSECKIKAFRGMEGCNKTDLNDNSCYYTMEYADGDRSEGILATEILWTEDRSFSQRVIFGCGKNNIGKHFAGFYAGILGFNQNNYSLIKQVTSSKFSFCLPPYGYNEQSKLYLYEFPPEEDYDDFTVPLIPNSDYDYYYLDFKGISINSIWIDVDPAVWRFNSTIDKYGVIVDTGTTITRFPREVYGIFRDGFIEEAKENFDRWPYNYDNFLDTCYNITPDLLGYFPTISFHFRGNNRLRLEKENIFIRVEKNMFCLAFAPLPSHIRPQTILGTRQLERTRMSFDLEEQKVIISPQNC